MAALTDEQGNANDMVLLDNASPDVVVDLLQKRFKNCKFGVLTLVSKLKLIVTMFSY